MSLQQQIEYGIETVIHETGKFPTVILVNPVTCEKLMEEIKKLIGDSFTSPIHIQHLKWRGIKVYRSEDVKEGEFIVK